MKRLLAVFAIALAFAWGPAASAQEGGWNMEAFSARYDIGAEGEVSIEESVTADFLEPRHGIYRYVPYKGKMEDGSEYRLGIELESAQLDGIDVPVKASRKNGNVVWRIGDPDETVTGRHLYLLRYRVSGAIRRFETTDEFSWNVTGEDWDAALPAAEAFVMLPSAPTDARLACFTGPYGSEQSDCRIVPEGQATSFRANQPGEPMTISVSVPKGLIGEPPLWKKLLGFARQHGLWLIPLLALGYAYRRWRAEGDDEPLGTVPAEYEPPAGLTPAETRALLYQNALKTDIGPTIVDLASRGYVRIEETEKKKLIGTSKEFVFHLAKDGRSDPSLRPFEQKLLSALFPDASVRTEMASLKKTFYAHIYPFTEGVMQSLTDRGYFPKHPTKVRANWIGVGVIFFALAIVVWGPLGSQIIGAGKLAMPIGAAGLIIALAGAFMPKWTPAGHAAARHAKGFREFIRRVEKHRAPWMEDQNVFLRALPYALAFGLGSKWAKAFADIEVPAPSWYIPVYGVKWTPASFNDAVGGWSKAFASAAMPSSSSGGGGFSGGGFGGGGGGSW